MGSKSKVAILMPSLLGMILLISSQVAARNFKEGEVVSKRNEVGDAKFVGVGGFYPGIAGGRYYDGNNFPRIVGGGYSGQGGYGVEGCRYGCCGAHVGGDCSRCCTIRG